MFERVGTQSQMSGSSGLALLKVPGARRKVALSPEPPFASAGMNVRLRVWTCDRQVTVSAIQSMASAFMTLALHVPAAFSENITEPPEPGFPATPAGVDPSLQNVDSARVNSAHANAAIFFTGNKLARFEYCDMLSDRSLRDA